MVILLINKFDSINKDVFKEPLQRNLWKKQIEIFCLGILRVYFFPEFEGFIHSDVPDLIDEDKNIGIEVCEAIDSKRAQATGEYIKINKAEDDRSNNKSIKIIRDCGYNYNCGVLAGPDKDENEFLTYLKSIIIKKIKLINNYKKSGVNQIGLVVYYENPICGEYLQDIINICKETSFFKEGYSFLYVVFLNKIYYVSLSSELKTIEIDKSTSEYIAILARFIAEGTKKFKDIEWTNLIDAR